MGPRPRMDFSRGRPPPMEDPAREKAIRSIFGKEFGVSPRLKCRCVGGDSDIMLYCVFPVANISFETTEEQLRAVLSEVGPVVSLK